MVMPLLLHGSICFLVGGWVGASMTRFLALLFALNQLRMNIEPWMNLVFYHVFHFYIALLCTCLFLFHHIIHFILFSCAIHRVFLQRVVDVKAEL